jgi:hypothetical protein
MKKKGKWIKNPGYQPKPEPIDGPALIYSDQPGDRRIWERAIAEAKLEPRDVLLYDKAAVREALREARERHTKRVKSNLP